MNEENEGYIRGLNTAKSIILHSKDLNQCLNSVLNALSQAEILEYDGLEEKEIRKYTYNEILNKINILRDENNGDNMVYVPDLLRIFEEE